MIEVEVKFKLPGTIGNVAKVAAANRFEGNFLDDVVQYIDWYYDIGESKLLRLRARKVGVFLNGEKLTFKGEKIQGKTREEIEINVSDANAAIRLIEKAFGAKPTTLIRKSQRCGHSCMSNAPGGNDKDERTACLSIDHVDLLGDFVELEVMATPKDAKSSQRMIEAWARQMFPGVEFIDKSYYEMVREEIKKMSFRPR